MLLAAEREAIVEHGKKLITSGLTTGSGGNLSIFNRQENLIAIRPKEAGDRRLTLTADQSRSLGWLALFIIPGAIFAMGVYTWWRRR